jgi:hypothetical protein
MDLFGKKNSDSQVAIVEPLGIIFIDWQLARIIGAEGRSKAVLEAFQQTHLEPDNMLSEIIGRFASPKNSSISLISSKQLNLLGEKRILELDKREWQFMIGLPSEVKLLIHEKKIYDEAVVAMQNGILPLIILESAGKGAEPKYSYVGTLLFEPRKNAKANIGGEVRFVSVLPAQFLNFYYENKSEFSAIATEAADLLSLGPKEIEEGIKQFSIIGSANLRDRYQILTLLTAMSFNYQFLSRNPADSQLTERFSQ